MPKWRNWQTRTFEGRVRQLVGVRVPPSAPSRLFSTSYVHFSALYINVCLVSIDYDSLGRGDSDFRTRSKIESSREGHFCGAILVTRPIVTAQRILSPLFALSTILGRGDSDFRTRSKIESSREGHFCGAILVTRPIVTAQRILSPLFALSTT